MILVRKKRNTGAIPGVFAYKQRTARFPEKALLILRGIATIIVPPDRAYLTEVGA